MTIDDQLRDEKLQYDINREVAKILALSSGKTDKYQYLTIILKIRILLQQILSALKVQCMIIIK